MASVSLGTARHKYYIHASVQRFPLWPFKQVPGVYGILICSDFSIFSSFKDLDLLVFPHGIWMCSIFCNSDLDLVWEVTPQTLQYICSVQVAAVADTKRPSLKGSIIFTM